jgi:hypothetical protein
MRFRVSLLLAVAVGTLLGGAAQAAASTLSVPANDRRLVVIEASGNVLSKSGRERLQGAIAEVVERQGLQLVSAKVLPEQLLGCELPGCLSPVAAATGAIFVLGVDAKFAKESFKLAIELWNSDDGKLLGRDRRDCPICDEQDLWGSAALLTQGLLERALREPAKIARPRPVARVIAAAPAAPAASPAVAQLGSERSKLAVYSGFALSAAGFAALVTGAYYLVVDGDSACFHCDTNRDTRKFGLPMAIAGGAALAAGAGLLAWTFWPSSTKVSLGPSGVRLAGRF